MTFPNYIRDYYVKDVMQILTGTLSIILSSAEFFCLSVCSSQIELILQAHLAEMGNKRSFPARFFL